MTEARPCKSLSWTIAGIIIAAVGSFTATLICQGRRQKVPLGRSKIVPPGWLRAGGVEAAVLPSWVVRPNTISANTGQQRMS